MAQNSTTSKEQSYKMAAILLGIALVIAVIGWVSAANKTVDTTGLADRLRGCEGVVAAADDAECSAAMNELRALLLEYQGVLGNIDTTPAPSDATTTPETPTVSTTSGGTFQLSQ